MEEEPWWKNLLKYFLHGLAFSVIMFLLSFVWAVILVILVVTGLLIGLIIGFIVLFFIMGGLNSFLTDLIWSIPIKTKWTSLLGHGFVLFIVLIIVGIPSIIISFVAPNLAIAIVLFIAYAFIDGFVAKSVATAWREEEKEEQEESDY